MITIDVLATKLFDKTTCQAYYYPLYWPFTPPRYVATYAQYHF